MTASLLVDTSACLQLACQLASRVAVGLRLRKLWHSGWTKPVLPKSGLSELVNLEVSWLWHLCLHLYIAGVWVEVGTCLIVAELMCTS